MTVESYQPANGTEGMDFEDAWCARCKADAAFRRDPEEADGCQILADIRCYSVTDPAYPKAWIYDADGRPKCTAFEPVN